MKKDGMPWVRRLTIVKITILKLMCKFRIRNGMKLIGFYSEIIYLVRQNCQRSLQKVNRRKEGQRTAQHYSTELSGMMCLLATCGY